MSKFAILLIPAIALSIGCSSAKGNKAAEAATAAETPQAIVATPFCADSAYAYIAKQVSFGPRVPGTQAAKECGDWRVEKLKQFGASDIKDQTTTVTAYNGDKLPIRNISASFRPDAPTRVLLLAHWDTRPWADSDPNPEMRNKPIDGANDGASGVGVLLEIARNISYTNPALGIDLLFVDAEDYGQRSDSEEEASDDSWALGTQYWAKHPTVNLNKIDHAILLDMVGGKDAVFPREYISQRFAAPVNDKVWEAARAAGLAARFPNRIGGGVTDDHVYLLREGIPAIDIIESNHPDTGTFPPYWHTQADNLSQIDTATLAAVGHTILTHLKNK